MEQIYTIPVNEAFEAAAADKSCGCPICTLYNKLEDNELDLILGASMMEPDVRIQTNREGFCRTHYDMMLTRKNRLGMALTLQSHLDELRGRTKPAGLTLPGTDTGVKTAAVIAELEESCYVCRRIEYHFSRMLETVVLLWETDSDFPAKFASQPYFCLPHLRRLLSVAKNKLSKKRSAEFSRAAAAVVEPYFDELRGDIDWFCKKFDYRYDEEPWYNSKDSVERAVKFLRGDLHNPPDAKKK